MQPRRRVVVRSLRLIGTNEAALCGYFRSVCAHAKKGAWSMSDKDLKETLEGLRKLREEFAASPQKARDFLVEAGFITPDGELTEHYRQDA
jgi:hypothetical protein